MKSASVKSACAMLLMALMCAAVMADGVPRKVLAQSAASGTRALLAALKFDEFENKKADDTVKLQNNCAVKIKVLVAYTPVMDGPLEYEEFELNAGNSKMTEKRSVGNDVFWKTLTAGGKDASAIDASFGNFDKSICLKLADYDGPLDDNEGNVCGWVKHVMPTDKGVDYTSYAC